MTIKLNDLEKRVVEALCISTRLTQAQVNSVFMALLFELSQNIQRGTNQVSIPFFGDFKLAYEKIPLQDGEFEVAEQIFVKPNALVSNVLHDTLAGRETQVKKYLKTRINANFQERLVAEV